MGVLSRTAVTVAVAAVRPSTVKTLAGVGGLVASVQIADSMYYTAETRDRADDMVVPLVVLIALSGIGTAFRSRNRLVAVVNGVVGTMAGLAAAALLDEVMNP